MVELYFDGGSRGNPGVSGSGWYIKYLDGEEFRGNFFVGDKSTNNEAEYWGLIKGLQYIVQNDFTEDIMVYGDSKLVIKQMTGEWKVKAENLKIL